MSKAYLAISAAPDKKLGYVSDEGKVYRSRVGIDDHIGGVDLASGKVYEARLGLDKLVGYVDLESGKVYLTRFGPDEYIGRVDADGSLHRHVPMGVDHYIGKVDQFISLAHSAGAMLLLVLPALEEKSQGEESDQTPDTSK
jgi:hypothetical protein